MKPEHTHLPPCSGCNSKHADGCTHSYGTREHGYEVKPVRIQRSRRKGSRLVSPNGLLIVCVTRPGKWGNPFRAELINNVWHVVCCKGGFRIPKAYKSDAELGAVRLFRDYLNNTGQQPGAILDEGGAHLKLIAKRELRGKNLACFCELGKPCHADVLLEIANS